MEMHAKRKCNTCGKIIAITYRIDKEDYFEYKTENTSDRFIDKWGNERNFCKDCMNRK